MFTGLSLLFYGEGKSNMLPVILLVQVLLLIAVVLLLLRKTAPPAAQDPRQLQLPDQVARLDDYARSVSLGARERDALGREFDLVTVQRKLKDAGRFVFIDRVKGNGSFLKFVEPTIAKATASAARLSDDEDASALSETLARVFSR